MAEIVAFLTNNSVPLIAPADLPTIRIRELATNGLVVTDSPMVEVGDGLYKFTFAADSSLEYGIRIDADPQATGQVQTFERYQGGAYSGIDERRLDRLYQGNTRTKIYTADNDIVTAGRSVPQGAVSHLEVDIKATDSGSFPGVVYFVVFNYLPADTADDAPRSSDISATAPVDGTFTSAPYPT